MNSCPIFYPPVLEHIDYNSISAERETFEKAMAYDVGLATLADTVNSVALILGPYRNLTTLAAATLALHPFCQVLNHAGVRLHEYRRLTWMQSPCMKTLREFLHAGFWLSKNGQSGPHGGSIRFSHAFHGELQRLYLERYGSIWIKEKPHCFIWKESASVTYMFRDGIADLGSVINNLPSLRFIIPIRNPIDIALSTQVFYYRYGVPDYLKPQFPDFSFQSALGYVMTTFQYCFRLKEEYPEKIYFLYQDALGRNVFERLEKFLGLPSDARWQTEAASCFVARRKYAYEPNIINMTLENIEKVFGIGSPTTTRLISLVETEVRQRR